MNQPPGGSVEADVETLRQTLEWDSEERRHMDGDPFQALANLTDHIGELEHERDMANAYADEQWQDEQRNVAMNEAQARIHYLEGRVGGAADEIVRKLVYEAGGSDTDDGAVLFQVTQLRPILDDVLTAALSPPMKGPNDAG